MTCIVVDVGNTSTTIALSRNGRMSRRNRLPTHGSKLGNMVAVLKAVSAKAKIDGVGVSSVVPAVNVTWKKAIRQITAVVPVFVHHEAKLGVGIKYPRPERIGADRLANASGAVALYGAPVVVADFGTALTFDVIDEAARYVGGVITPGLPFMTDYLAEKTALLPRIQLKGRCGRVGKSTEGAMRIGAKIGYRGIVREITSYLLEGLGTTDVTLCATGGFAEWALQDLGMPFQFCPDLTLCGISRICELNQGQDR